MKDRVLIRSLLIQLRRLYLEDFDLGNVETMRICDRLQLFARFRQGYVEGGLVINEPREQKLNSQCRLAGAWVALNQINMPGGQSAVQNVIQSSNSGQKTRPYARFGHCSSP